MFYLILDEKVVQKSEAIFPVSPGLQWVSGAIDAADFGWEYRNSTFIRPPESPPPDYRELRAREYPSFGDQLDMLWHSMNNNEIPRSEAFYTAIKTVKDRYPASGDLNGK